MYRLPVKLKRGEKESEAVLADRAQAEKNPLVPGSRILRCQDAVPVYDNSTACQTWCYPLCEINDLGFFSYMEKKKDTDTDRPWALQSHPEVNLYYYILEGNGTLILEGGGFLREAYEFEKEELVIVPRGIPFRMEGEWNAICFHSKTSVYGGISGISRYPYSVLSYDKPLRPVKEESDALYEPGTRVWLDSVLQMEIQVQDRSGQVKKRVDLSGFRKDLEAAEAFDVNALYHEVTPVDNQTTDLANRKEAGKNSAVLGARVIKRKDAPEVYNANAALKQSSYPLTWTDDIAICNLAVHKAESDADRPFDAHSHPDIEEYKFILAGYCDVTIGAGDETCEEEFYHCEAGDLQILPRGMTHVDAGSYTALVFHSKQSVFGKTPGNAMYPHAAYIYTRPSRPTKEEEAALNNPGDLIFMNSRETYNVYAPNPILRAEKNPTDMLHLRPDLFPGDGGGKEEE